MFEMLSSKAGRMALSELSLCPLSRAPHNHHDEGGGGGGREGQGSAGARLYLPRPGLASRPTGRGRRKATSLSPGR